MCGSVGDYLKVLIKLAICMLRVIYFFFKLLLKPHKKVTFLSRQSDTVTVDFQLLRDALLKSGFDGEIRILTKKIAPSLTGKIGYLFHILVQMYHIATSKAVVVDGYCIAVCVLNHKKEQSFIQLWHALNIIKKFGFQALDKPWGHKRETAECMCMHRNYTHIVASSEASGKVLTECFNASMEKIVLLPLPRIDYIINSPQKYDEIEKEYPAIFEKPILLYAPTFRAKEQVDLSWIAKTVDLKNYNVIVKLHPADKQGIDSKVSNRVIVDDKFSSFDWMKVCDRLVTDYSGMGFEAMLLRKPVYYYLYDYEEYKENNGLNLDLSREAISNTVCNTKEQLKILLKEEYDFSKAEAYVEKYLSVGTKNCSERLAQFVISLI